MDVFPEGECPVTPGLVLIPGEWEQEVGGCVKVYEAGGGPVMEGFVSEDGPT